MTTLTITAKGDKGEMTQMLQKHLDAGKQDKVVLDIVKALLDHVKGVSDKEVVTFSIRGQIVVQHLKRNHQEY